ncbi:MAG: DUF1501 domain-containing protein, partial [Chthoniobacteraceae bacterium]|nr:DUF1501 domain-containing protein [Chthoniobacteraceae bacterium]
MNCNDAQFFALNAAAREAVTRRTFLLQSGGGIGLAALGGLLSGGSGPPARAAMLPGFPNYAPKAKRIIYLFQSGAPSQMDLFDPKPEMSAQRGKDLPESIRKGQRLTTMTSGQKSFPIAPSIFKFAQYGQSGAWFSEVMPHMSGIADEWCIVRSMHTEAINHDPAITFMQTGSQLAGRPSIGAWTAYGLGSENSDLPSYVVLTSFGTGRKGDQPLYDRLWSAGFLPAKYQGVKFRNKGEPVLYLNNPAGMDRALRRDSLDELGELNQHQHSHLGDPEIQNRIAQYEL